LSGRVSAAKARQAATGPGPGPGWGNIETHLKDAFGSALMTESDGVVPTADMDVNKLNSRFVSVFSDKERLDRKIRPLLSRRSNFFAPKTSDSNNPSLHCKNTAHRLKGNSSIFVCVLTSRTWQI
jgi:hypothetical protein